MDLGSFSARRVVIEGVAIGGALVATTGLVAILESVVEVPNASAAYLLGVIVLGVAFGTVAAIVGALGGFLAYDFLFVEPVHTFAVVDTGELLNLLLLLVVGLVVGRLGGQQRDRADAAELRAREARGLFRVSRILAVSDTPDALAAIVKVLGEETRMSRIWIGLTGSTALETVVADTGVGAVESPAARHQFLRRTPGDAPAEWVGLHQPVGLRRTVRDPSQAAHRVAIEAGGRSLGSLWSLRPRSLGTPPREETRLLAAAADQVGQALERDRLRAEATRLEIGRRSDALKSALLDTVSHDLRTPLATIRAAAGSLLDHSAGSTEPAALSAAVPPDPRGHPLADPSGAALVIDRQARYLDRLVTNLLDLSRVEAGALRPDLQPIDLADAVMDALDRLASVLAGREIATDISAALPPVLVDEVHLDAILTNLLENAVAYSPPDAPIVVRAKPTETGTVRLTIEDGGRGVPPETLELLFDKFYRVPTAPTTAGRGSGIGLAVVRGLAEASGAVVGARRSDLGGLAIDIDLPTDAGSFRRGPAVAAGSSSATS